MFSILIAPSRPPPPDEGAAPNRPPPPQEVDEMEQEAPLQAANPIGVRNTSYQYMELYHIIVLVQLLFVYMYLTRAILIIHVHCECNTWTTVI